MTTVVMTTVTRATGPNNQNAAMTMKGRISPPSTPAQTKEQRSTPFKRGRSKVFYASDDKSFIKYPISKSASVTLNSSYKEFNNNDVCSNLDTEPLLWGSVLDTCKEASEGGSSGDEALSPSGSSIRSPVGSLRSSLGGSLRGSQDSGYSDSGESNSGGIPELDIIESPPKVKHISRVFFGGGSGRARLYNDTIVTTPSISPSISGKHFDTSNSISRRPKSCNLENEPELSNYNSRSSPTSMCDSDEPQYQLENKSILDISVVSYDEQASRKTGAIRKSSFVATHKKNPRRSTSVDKLLDEPKHRKPCILKGRRRWSTIDPKVVNINSETSPDQSICSHSKEINSCKSLSTVHESSLRSTHEEHRKINETPKKTNIKRLRIHPTALATEMKNGALGQWLQEVRYRNETECMNTLQSKSLATDLPLEPLSPVDAVRGVQRRAHAVSTEFARLCHKLELQQRCRLPSLSRSLVANINAFLRETQASSTMAAGSRSHLTRQIEVVRQICHRLMEITTASEIDLTENVKKSAGKVTVNHTFESLKNINTFDTDRDTKSNITNTDDEKLSDSADEISFLASEADVAKEISQVVTALGHAFTKLVDIMLSVEIKEVVSYIEADSSSFETVRSSLRQMTSLGVDGGHICRLIAKLGGVRALLTLCLEPKKRCLRVAALRALATVCCVADGIAHLEKAGGIEVVVDILCAADGREDEKSEAAAVLAQITSPWVEDNHSIVGLHPYVEVVVTALTDLVRSTESAEIFLLGSAALANLTFLTSEGCVGTLIKAGTARVLLDAANDTSGLSVFTKDQIATVIASMCSSKDGAAEVAREDGVDTLVALLNTKTPAHPARLPEVTAAERVQQKSAIALSRLCSNSGTSCSVLKAGGGARLVKLCKDEEQRNHSDAVLVACLAALRKIASSCDKEQLREIGAADLVEPRLLDSFLTFSSRQESYV